MKNYLTGSLAVLLIGCVAAGLLGQGEVKTMSVQRAVAQLHGTEGHKISGAVYFTQKEGYVEVTGQIQGLTPGLHGFHIHEFGECSAKGENAGGHFNPTSMPHADPGADKRHAGDLGNIKANEAGLANINIQDKNLKLNGPYSIIRHALVVHGKADDLKSQPSGNAGERVACCVIGIANPAKK